MRSSRLHLAFAAVVAARSSLSNCTNPAVRIEWSSLDSSEQIAYLDAERCLWDLPAETHLSNVTDRYTDPVAVHQSLTDYVHGDGVFLPWHRYFVHAHKTLLRKHCNYTGPIPT
ncbi:Di-copper centre-containing protein [Aspergillus eucalypticola CBS 122712]|uniref:Di-copper centre-containing protein n=1 Tax=Aspergillus eucalypticola (strain CBS 122712 / IBT 29274) TaxID=1448314 RepID=A0A317VMV2_ASPEC|nr:Di-copper centre-containing protein [Aspergillus eucalypticola CBS 122712]PWY75656.1 Di-copper centre-containing protein [Aspergillus eucalypticola CBS 122712]